MSNNTPSENYGIAIDSNNNRYLLPEYTEPVDITGIDTLNPSVSIPVDVVNEVIQASKEGNQFKVNYILSNFF